MIKMNELIKNEAISKEEIISIANNYIRKHFGDVPGVRNAKLDLEKNWILEIGADIMKVIRDDQSGAAKVRFLRFDDLGKIIIDLNGNVKEKPYRADLAKDIILKMRKNYLNVAKILTEIAPVNFADLIIVEHMLAPLEKLVLNLSFKGKLELINIPLNSRKYIDILKRLNLIEIKNSKVFPSNDFILLEEEKKSLEELKRSILKLVVQKEVHTLKDDFNIKVLGPYINLSSICYTTSLQANDIIHFTYETLKRNYDRIYRKVDEWTLVDYITKLKKVNLLEVEDKFVYCNKNILNQLIDYPNSQIYLSDSKMKIS
jgi:hypothetical protein